MANDVIVINGTELAVKEFNGERVVTFKDIDTLHERPDGTAKRNFASNKQYFIENEDYFVAKSSDFLKYEIRTLENKSNRGTVLITKSGYLMLIKSFRDDLSWRLQRELVRGYFELLEQKKQEAQPKSQSEIILLLAQQNVDMERKLTAIEDSQRRTDERIEKVKDILSQPVKEDWQHNTLKEVYDICMKNGIDYATAFRELYAELEKVAHCNLSTRLNHVKERMKMNGAAQSQINKKHKIHVINDDEKLRMMFDIIRKRWALKYLD